MRQNKYRNYRQNLNIKRIEGSIDINERNYKKENQYKKKFHLNGTKQKTGHSGNQHVLNNNNNN